MPAEVQGHSNKPRERSGRLHPVIGLARHELRLAMEQEGFLPRNMTRGQLASNPVGNHPLTVLIGLSGGPDSLALAVAASFYAAKGMFRVGAVIIDHQLQPGSGAVAERAASQARELGLDPVITVPVAVHNTGMGPEAAARQARQSALEKAARDLGADLILLGHTLDDQAEQVLLALTRGSGTKALSGIPRRRDFEGGTYLRPFLDLRREQTEAICKAAGLTPWQDPTNSDGVLMRSRVRTRILPWLENELGPGLATALHRSASILADDADFVAEQAQRAYAQIREQAHDGAILLSEDALRALHPALQSRVIALAVTELGGEPTFERINAAVVLLDRTGSAGPVQMPGQVSVYRQPRPKGASARSGRYGRLEVKSSAPAANRREAPGMNHQEP